MVQGASLKVAQGEVVALLGRNGMGKTSLMRSIMALPAPQVRAGAVFWKGEELTGLPSHRIAQRKIGYVPQGRRLFPSLTVTEHLTLLKPSRATQGWTIGRVFDAFPRLDRRLGSLQRHLEIAEQHIGTHTQAVV